MVLPPPRTLACLVTLLVMVCCGSKTSDRLALSLTLVHEGTLVHAVSILALWCNRFTTEVPKKLTDWFKKVFSLKTSTSAVRHAYLQCMLASFRGELSCLLSTLPSGLSLRAHLMNSRPNDKFLGTTVVTSSLAGLYPERTYNQNVLY